MNSVSLFAFANSHGLFKSQALRLARLGRIAGAVQDLSSRRWSVFPPAELLVPLQTRITWRDRFDGGQP